MADDPPDDVDFFASKDEPARDRRGGLARRLGSPLDSVLKLTDAAASNSR